MDQPGLPGKARFQELKAARNDARAHCKTSQDWGILTGARKAIPRQLQAQTTGFWTMPNAIAETRFTEILHLGSDFTPLEPLDWVFNDERYLRHGALLSVDLDDVRTRPWFRDAWLRVNLTPPSCESGARCRAVWESDGAVMALDRRRCPAGEALKELATDGLASGRYGRQGDKECYRLAWELAGCSVAYLPYPGIACDVGNVKVKDAPVDAVHGVGLLHRDDEGKALGLHWAWGKEQLLSNRLTGPFVVSAQAAPIDGYADVAVDTVDFDDEGFVYSPRLTKCYGPDGSQRPCDLYRLPERSSILVKAMRFLLYQGRFLFFEDCPEGVSMESCRLRRWNDPVVRRHAKETLLSVAGGL